MSSLEVIEQLSNVTTTLTFEGLMLKPIMNTLKKNYFVGNSCRTLIIRLLAHIFFSVALMAQPVTKDMINIGLADPTIFGYKGMYYLYGTVEGNANNGFIVYMSKDMKRWNKSTITPDGFALKKGDAYGTAGFWAPQIFVHQDSFYMAYVADERISIATSTNPAGPFTQKTIKPLDAPVKQIDPFVFIDDDGKKYLYHVRLTNGNKIFVAQMNDDFSGIDSTTVKECIIATVPWENTANTNWPVTEGPSVLKHKNIYYLFYTANDFRNPDYAVGYATSMSPYGPWKKYRGNPIISKRNIGTNGTGHGDFVTGRNNKLSYVFHTHNSDTKVTPRKTAIVEVKFSGRDENGPDTLKVDEESFRYLVVEKTE